MGMDTELTAADRAAWADLFMDNHRADLQLFVCPQLIGNEVPGNIEDPGTRKSVDGAAPVKT